MSRSGKKVVGGNVRRMAKEPLGHGGIHPEKTPGMKFEFALDNAALFTDQRLSVQGNIECSIHIIHILSQIDPFKMSHGSVHRDKGKHKIEQCTNQKNTYL